MIYILFFFNDTATTEIYTLSLHDALPIFSATMVDVIWDPDRENGTTLHIRVPSNWNSDVQCRSVLDRKSTRLNSSHVEISYAVFCLKKKKRDDNADAQHSSVTRSVSAIDT